MVPQKFANNALGTLAGAISGGATSFSLHSGEGALFPVLAAGEYCWVRLGEDTDNEVVKVTGRSSDAFTCDATSDAWAADTLVILGVSKEMLTDITLLAELAALALANSLGATSATTGCIGGGIGTTILKVTAQSSPNLTVQIAAGTCFIAGVLAGDLDGVASLSGFAAPSANSRIDIVQISNAGVISRKAGTENASPTAPTVDAGNMVLAQVYNRVGQTSIKNTSDGSNGYITDARAWIA